MKKETTQSLNFWFNFDPRFPLRIAGIKKKKHLCEQTSAIWLSKN